MRRRLLLALSLAAATAVAAVGLTNASWTTQEWTTAALGTQGACGTDTGFTTTASGRFLGGSLLGTNLDALAALQPASATRAAAAVGSPAGATHVTAGPTDDTYLNPLNVTALGAIGIDLSGLTVGLPLGSAGAVNQYARVTSTGYSAGAAGLVSDSGGLGVTPTTPANQLPQPASIGLASLLPVSGIANLALKVGAVGAASTLDWCAAMHAAQWGGAPTTGSTRSYGIAGLGLALDSPLVAGVTGAVSSAVTSVDTAVTGLVGPTGSIATTLQSRLTTLLGSLGLGSYTAAVSVTGLDLHTTIDPLLTQKLTDGVVTIDLSNGHVGVDLAKLLGGVDGLNSLAPNTQLVIDAAVANALVSRVGALLDTWTATVLAALTAAIRAATLNVAITADARLAGADIIQLGITGAVGLGAVLDGTATLAVTADVLPLLPAVQATVDAALTLLGLGTLSSVASGLVTPLATGLLAPVTTLLATTLIGLVTTLGTTLATVTAPLVTALSGVFSGLPGILSVMVNVQPDRPGAPAGSSFTAGIPPYRSPQYTVSALRLGVLDAVGGALTYVTLATASAGANGYTP
ncbi:MAG: hypothetical protein JWN36_36 [Microbacteriaceae bacterium]|nr:hypothetical protein [Microbacteriaceae bacterium]